MPLIRKTASDVTTYRRVSATNLPVPTIKSSAYTAPLRNIIAPIARASDAGAGASPGNTVLQVYGRTPLPTGLGGSMYFPGLATNACNITETIADTLSFGTGDFTVEWWQYLDPSTDQYDSVLLTDPSLSPETPSGFQVTYVQEPVGVYRFSLNMNGTKVFDSDPLSMENEWIHYAITRESGILRVFMNGVLLSEVENAEDILGTAIGIGNAVGSVSSYNGLITNMHWVKGLAKYTAAFTPPTSSLPAIPGYSTFLLLMNTADTLFVDSAGTPGLEIVGVDVSWSSSSPYTA